jgi:hypothetical protein
MTYTAETPDQYLEMLPPERKAPFSALRKTIRENLPPGFEERISYGMIGYVVPHEFYPAGYHADPSQPLPFMAIASQKNHIALYHNALYADAELSSWFASELHARTGLKPDMGKSCIRFRNPEKIPLDLIGELCRMLSAEDWVERYQKLTGRKQSP